jgi:DNA mismatch repair protein MutS2
VAAERELPQGGRELHLIGCRLEEALARLDKFLDDSVLSGWTEVRIVHGKGTGRLMKGVREHLAGHPLVAGFRAGEPYEGGSGATVVTIR